MRCIQKCPLSLAIALALTSQSLYAQQLDTLTVTGTNTTAPGTSQSGLKMDADWRQVPQSVSQVERVAFEQRGAVKLDDALRGVPGINRALGEGARDHFSIRGYDALNDLYRNGLRDGGSAQAYRSLQNIERIDVIKGAAGALYGRGSAGGLINLVTKKADGERVRELGLSAGSFSQRGLALDVGDQLGSQVNGRLNMEYRSADSFVDHVEGDTLFIAPSLRFELSERSQLGLDLEYLNQSQTPYRGVPSVDGKPVNVDSSTYYGGLSDYQDNESVRANLALTQQLTPDMQWRNSIYYSRVEMEQSATRNKSVADGLLNRSVVAFAFDPQVDAGLQSELSWQLSSKHQLLFGAELAHMERTSTSTGASAPATDLLNPVSVSYPQPVLAANRTNSINSYALYGQDLIQISSQLSLLAGARYDHINTHQRTASGAKLTTSEGKLSPRLGLSYAISPQTSLYTSWGRSYQLPYGGIYSSATKAALLETSLSEIGVKAELLENQLQLGASLFQLDRESPQTDAMQQVVDISRDRHEGIELEAHAQLTPQWQLSAGYTWLDARNRDSGMQPNDVPEHTLSLWNSYEPAEGWTLAGGLYYVSERFAGNNEQVKQDSYQLVDLMASYETGSHRIQLNINNLLDEEYTLGATGGGSGLHQVGYGAPRSANLSYRLSF